MIFHKRSPLLLLLSLSLVFAKVSEEELLLQQEISDYRRKIDNLTEEFSSLSNEQKRDLQEKENIASSHSSTITTLQSDISKLKAELKTVQNENRKLSSEAARIERSISSLRNQETRLIEALISEGNSLADYCNTLPELIVNRERTALTFLITELSAGSVSGSEGIERLFTILNSLKRKSESSDVWQGTSPVTGGTGSYFYIRLSLFYLATVSENGTTAYLFTGNDWKIVKDSEEKEQLLFAAQTALGNRTPEFSSVPLSLPVIVGEPYE